ncbi:Uncharacterised protein [Candidatus Tiddalikarchaeum anstoanum]|nr:Uncharacterised protein [Candidatus Tiddalikarchaeum anstoanum]
MRKGSAITLSIFIMMIVLGSLLAYTAFYVDQVMLRPVVQMYDSETDLKCFFIISNIVGGEYLRDGEPVPSGSLRSELNDLYGLRNGKGAYLGDREEFFNKVLALQYGRSETIVREQDVLWTTV